MTSPVKINSLLLFTAVWLFLATIRDDIDHFAAQKSPLTPESQSHEIRILCAFQKCKQ